jgi:hypothetical protein
VWSRLERLLQAGRKYGERRRALMYKTKFLIQILAIVLVTVGCATKLKSSSRSSVIIQNMSWNQEQADKIAEIECRKNERNAILTSRIEDSARSYYQCVD